MKINNVIFLLAFVFLLAACDDKDKAEVDPNVIQRGEAEYTITAQHPSENENKLSYNFGIAEGGAAVSEPDYSVIWDFGDGTERKSGVSLNHIYKSEGDYTVTAYITDNINDKFRTASTTVIAGGEPDIYNSEIVAYREEDRRAYRFVSSAISSLGEELRYSWNYGDGTPATLPKRDNSAKHSFSKYGDNYTVQLSIDNGRGDQGSILEKSITVQTDNPDLLFECNPDGYAISADYVMLGQYIKCQPKLVGGSIPDIQYSWAFYSEITKDQYDTYGGKDNASLIIVKYITDSAGKEIPNIVDDVTSEYTDSFKYYELDGLGKSEVEDAVRYMYEEGGAKFITVTGSSQQFLNSDIGTLEKYGLPSNCMLGTLQCKKDTFDTSGLKFKCEADAYAMVKDETDNTKKYIKPLDNYTFTAKDNDGKILQIISNKDTSTSSQIQTQCTTDNSTYSNYSESEKNYTKCKVELEYTADRYDSSTGYTTMELEASQTETVDGNPVDVTLKQSRDFKVEAPVLSVSYDKSSNKTEPLKFNFEASFGNVTISNTNLKYYWDFGDGSSVVETSSNTVSHTYQSANAQYEVSVYATSDKFDRTMPAKSLIRMSPGFRGSKFEITRMGDDQAAGITGNKDNIYKIVWDYLGTVDGNVVDTKYEFTLQNANGSYSRTFVIDFPNPCENQACSNIPDDWEYEFITDKPTEQNILTGNDDFGIPYGTPFLLTLKITNEKNGSEYIVQNAVPVASARPPLPSHPGNTNNSKTGWFGQFDTISTDDNSQVIPVSNSKCYYNLNPGNINSDLNSKWGLGQPTYSAGTLTVETNCNQGVHVGNDSGSEQYRKMVLSIISGPIVLENGIISKDNSIDRYLDIRLKAN